MHRTVTAGSESVSSELRRAQYRDSSCTLMWQSLCEVCGDIYCVLLRLYPKNALDLLSGGSACCQKPFPCHCQCLWPYQGYMLSWIWGNAQPPWCSMRKGRRLVIERIYHWDSNGWGWMSKTGMLNGTWLGMIPHHEFIMPTVSTVMSGRAPCQLLHATITARQWAAGSRATLLINRTDTMPEKTLICSILWSGRMQTHFAFLC